MPLKIVSEVRVLDLGEGVVATEYVGFVPIEQSFTLWPRQFNMQITLPFNVIIITYPYYSQEKENKIQQ